MLRLVMNILTVGLCGFAKIPTISHIFKTKSTLGLSFSSLLLESTSFNINMCYFFVERYKLFDYLDYPLLVVQNNIVVVLCLIYGKNKSKGFIALVSTLYLILIYVITHGYLPHYVLPFFVTCCSPITISSKLLQIYEIVSTQRGDLVSKLPWLIYSLSSSGHFYKIITTTGDRILLFNFGSSIFLNMMIILIAQIYSKPPKKTD